MDGSQKNGINTDAVLGKAFIERHEEEGYVDVAIVLDATRSRKASIDKIKRDFYNQMDKLSAVATDKLRLSIFSYGNGTDKFDDGSGDAKISDPTYHGTFTDFHSAADAVSRIQCEPGLTGIFNTLGLLSQMQSMEKIPQLDAVILYGDTVDELSNSNNLDSITTYARNMAIPIVTFLERTYGGSGTVPDRDIPAMRQISEATGVKNCPIPYEFNNPQVGFADYVRVIAAATQGPEAVAELKATGEIPDYVWETVPERTLETVAEPEPEPTGACGPSPVPVEEPETVWYEPEEERRREGGFFGGILSNLITAAIAAGVLLLAFNQEEDVIVTPIPEPVPEPEPIITTDNLETLLREGALVFDSRRYQEAFPTGEAVMTPNFMANLTVLGNFLEENLDFCPEGITFTGHTDPRGPNAYNLGLSQDRANAAQLFLSESFSLAVPVQAFGRGEEELLFSYTDAEVSSPSQEVLGLFAQERRIGVRCEGRGFN
ncbi:MAG: OmpA family protein [Pseudomonadota bacterium]